VAAHRARLKKDAVRILAHARLRQREALVDVAVEEAQHLAAVHVARALQAHTARRDRQQRPQRLLERGVHAVDGVVDEVDVEVALGGDGHENDVVADAHLRI